MITRLKNICQSWEPKKTKTRMNMSDVEISSYIEKIKAMHAAEEEFIETKLKEMETLQKPVKQKPKRNVLK